MHAPASELPTIAFDILARIRAKAPRVHCITNTVAQNLTANTLLAVGAVPSMTIAAQEVGGFMQRANALLINLGTFDSARGDAAEQSIEAADELKLPWVLDPVFVDRSASRMAYAKRLLQRRPNVLRLNHAELFALVGISAERKAVQDHAAHIRTVIGLTGPTDLVTDGARVAVISNGHPLMAKITALGCAESALVAACLAVETDAWMAAAAALLMMGIAGEFAAQRARGPGSFGVEILDALHALDRDMIVTHAKVK